MLHLHHSILYVYDSTMLSTQRLWLVNSNSLGSRTVVANIVSSQFQRDQFSFFLQMLNFWLFSERYA